MVQGVPVEDLATASHLLVRALAIREKYMAVSHQEFPTNVQRSAFYQRSYLIIINHFAFPDI